MKVLRGIFALLSSIVWLVCLIYIILCIKDLDWRSAISEEFLTLVVAFIIWTNQMIFRGLDKNN